MSKILETLEDDLTLNLYARLGGEFGLGIGLLVVYPLVISLLGFALGGVALGLITVPASVATLLGLMHFNAESIRKRHHMERRET